MKQSTKKNLRVLALAGVLLGASTTLVVNSPALYRLYCAITGYGGTVNRVVAKNLAPPTADKNTITVSFDANVAPGLPWEFHPVQRKVETHLGQPTKIYYYARNNSDKTIVARAAFNVTPYAAATYFFKIQCFCFTNEKLAPGQSVKMPVVLYVDEQLAKDPNTRDVHNITLSYTFYRQNDSSAEVKTSARDLKAGSEALDATLDASKKADFENDAPRR
jgi:cytochrome c oxidase assembly protein subunit 11